MKVERYASAAKSSTASGVIRLMHPSSVQKLVKLKALKLSRFADSVLGSLL